MRRLILVLATLALASGGLVGAPSASAGINTPCVGYPFQGAGTTHQTLTVAGRPRSYELHVPSGYSPVNRYPVVFNFHGAGWTGTEQLAYSEYVPFANAHGIIVVAPNADPALGYWAPWNTTVNDV